MKELFSKAKLDKLRNIFWVLLIMGCHIIYLQFLVVSFYDIGLFFVVTVVAVLYDKLIASKGFDAIVNNACICWGSSWGLSGIKVVLSARKDL